LKGLDSSVGANEESQKVDARGKLGVRQHRPDLGDSESLGQVDDRQKLGVRQHPPEPRDVERLGKKNGKAWTRAWAPLTRV